MNYLDYLKVLFTSFFKKEDYAQRKMKRVFQWRRYLAWKDLEPEEKLIAKRMLLLPIIAYLIIGFFNQNILLIVLFLVGYVLYKKFEKGGIIKK